MIYNLNGMENITIKGKRSRTRQVRNTHHDRDFNATHNIKEFGLQALSTDRRKVKPADCPLVDDQLRVLKNNGKKK